jgi:predicted SprT family Zn-dependent metalloprotease
MAITNPRSTGATPPTVQAYHEMQLAYEFFNRELFGARLPPCLITFQRKGSATLGYYAPKRYATAAGTTTDEIALNPRHFKSRSLSSVMATLVHEMVHLWQHHFGHPSRSNYHNKEWASEMLRVGLHPSCTGAPGGRMTGQQMHHYVVTGGRFDGALTKLRAMLPGITWLDASGAEVLPKGLRGFEPLEPSGLSGRRTVYLCPGCKDRAEGKSSLCLICGKCDLEMNRDSLR